MRESPRRKRTRQAGAGAGARGRRAFTLVEIMVVVTIIGLLATVAVPVIARVRSRARISRVASDLRTFSHAFETYALQNGGWPPDANPGVVPAGLEGELKSAWTDPTPLGGHYQWNNWATLKKITIFEAFDSAAEQAELDRKIDDGNGSTGSFRRVNAHYSLILEETP